MKHEDFIQSLRTILARKTSYRNVYPYNLGYYDGSSLSFDCWNLVKAICWSNGTIADNWRVGNYAIMTPSELGDWNGRQILDHCSDVSSDMAHIQAGEYLLYEGDSHAGIYFGDGKVVECTVGWGQNGVILSDIDDYGRSFFKGVQRGRWYRHGKLPFVKYPSKEYPTFEQGQSIKIRKNAKVYGMNIYFADFVYDMVLTVKRQDGEKVVAYKGDDWYIGDVSAWDVIPYEEPSEPEPLHPAQPEPEPEPEPAPEPQPQPEPEDPPEEEPEHISFLTRLIKAFLEVIRDVFKKKEKE